MLSQGWVPPLLALLCARVLRRGESSGCWACPVPARAAGPAHSSSLQRPCPRGSCPGQSSLASQERLHCLVPAHHVK